MDRKMLTAARSELHWNASATRRQPTRDSGDRLGICHIKNVMRQQWVGITRLQVKEYKVQMSQQ